jgi:uncharacterized SAM-binding protein YcdF (DUF218 family)
MRAPDAILVLGGRVRPGGRPAAPLLRRCRAAADEAARWPATPLIACGGRRWNGVVEADAIASELAQLGVDPARIARERLSLTTLENLIEGRALACPASAVATSGGEPLLAIVTCDWHLPRALAIARELELTAVGVPAPSREIGGVGRFARTLRATRERVQTLLDVSLARRRR